jgi:hypothetical protein
MKIAAVAFALLLCFINSAEGFIFTLEPGKRKCFTEELSTRERVRFQFQMAASYAPFVTTTITGPDGGRLFEKKPSPRDHQEWIYPYRAGAYAICFSSQERSKLSAASFEVTLKIQDATAVQNEENAKRARERDSQADRRRPIMDQAAFIEQGVDTLHRDYAYLKEREIAMRDTNESTNTRTWAVTVVTVLIVLTVSFLRFYTLKRYLQKKKILE